MINADDKNLYCKHFDELFNRLKVSQETKSGILKVQLKLGKKKLTEDGSNGKKNDHEEAILHLQKDPVPVQLFSKVLETMKRYVVLFQHNEPAIFRLFLEQLVLFREFILYFVRPKIINKYRTVSSLMSINFEDRSNQLPQKLLVVDIGASKIIKKEKQHNI